MTKFVEEKYPTTLVLEISNIKMDLKEKVKYFNQRFLKLLKKIPISLHPTNEVLIEFYTTSLLITPNMFVKRVGKITLRETFDEEIKVEKEIIILISNPYF